MLEDLEASAGFQEHQDVTVTSLFKLARSAAVRIESRVMRLQRLVFASDFLLGQHQSRTLALSYLAIQDMQLQTMGKNPSQVSKIKLSAWVKTLPIGLRVSVVTAGAERHATSTITACDGKFLCLAPNLPGMLATAVPLSAIQCIEVDVVDNKTQPLA